MSFTIGSLFDGSGGFPLAAFMCGGVPVWASEIEPYPIAVTKTRFPYMKHLGSVTNIKGNEIEPVDVISFGSPCQDLSVAGKRAGLKHEDNGDEETTRSGLFMDAVRIIKEMWEATNGKYPRFAVWENVPGAFSSNKGEDFRIVLEELIKIVEPTAVMPTVPKNGWPYSDFYCGDGWSLAYRVLDAQFWGVPQRRRRIYLVLDLGGQCAGKVSFERKGLRGHFETGRAPWQGIAGDAENRVGTADREGDGVIAVDQGGGKSGANFHFDLSPTLTCTHGGEPVAVYALDQQGGKGGANCAVDVMPTICSDSHGTPHAVAYGWPLGFRPENTKVYEEVATTICNGTRPGFTCGVVQQYLFENHSQDSRYKGPLDVCPMLPAQLGTGGNNQPFVVESKVYESRPMDSRIKELEDVSPTVSVKWHKGAADTPLVCEPVAYNGENITSPFNKVNPQPGDPCHTLGTDSRNYLVTPIYCIDGDKIGKAERSVAYCIGNGQVHDAVQTEKEVCKTLNCMCDPMKVLIEETPIVLDRAFYNQGANALYEPQLYEDGTCPTIVAKGPSAVCVRYVVRRITPTECARLQGFPDRWATPDAKSEFTDEEYKFWLNVRNTHAEINGKATKDYTRDQMLNWYNKLHTDSAEYKLWGNGIALPCALYVMQGIAEAFS